MPDVTEPPAPEYSRLRAAYEAYAYSENIDLRIGHRTHRLFREAGLTDVEVDAVVHVYPVGHSRRSIFRDFVNNVGTSSSMAASSRVPRLRGTSLSTKKSSLTPRC
jgi:hypothetical protein